MEQRTTNAATDGAPGHPLVSVIVNNYNYARFLGEAIDSALAQAYTPLEVIVVDDGSTDESRDVIASYGDRVIAVLKENGGQGSALNAGFAVARGDVVIFLDADDALLPAAARTVVDRLEPGVTKVYWPLWEMDTEGKATGTVIPTGPLLEGNLRDLALRNGPSACREVPTSGNAWSRDFLERVLPMPEQEFRINGDCYLSTLAPIYGEIRTVAEPHSRYRVHGANQYVLMTIGDKGRRQFDMYVRRCELLAEHFHAVGIHVDPNRWQDGNWHYDYLERVWDASQEIASLIPEGGRFVFMDDGLWGDGRAGTAAIEGRIAIPFLECGGAYHGLPPDDETAIRELGRLRAEAKPSFLIIIWTAFWWLEHYAGFAAHLRETFPCVMQNDRIVAFDLTA
jgi:glycosyltransferase involved in cell wall biosynthesis